MARYGEARAPEQQSAPVHLGFKSDGGMFRSEVPVTNAMTLRWRPCLAASALACAIGPARTPAGSGCAPWPIISW